MSVLHKRWSIHERENRLTLPWKPEHRPQALLNPWPKEREGLYSPLCPDSVHRVKFICPKRSCRRSIKPFYALDINHYEISEGKVWRVRPNPDVHEVMKQVMKNRGKTRRASPELDEDTMDDEKRLIAKYKADPLSLSGLEKEALVWTMQWSWDMDVEKRCPGCGDAAVPVGSNFRSPARRGEKGWRRVEGWLKEGKSLEAMFVCCATVEQHRVMVEKALETRKERGVVEVEFPWEEPYGPDRKVDIFRQPDRNR